MLPRVQWFTVGEGQASALDTLHRMRSQVQLACALPIVRQTAVGICWDTGTNTEVQAALIRLWLERHVGFLRDPYGVEELQQPQWMLAQLASVGHIEGDCDDVAMLGAALGMAIGLRARFVMIGRAGAYEHVWAELTDPGGKGDWFELDITRPHQPDFSSYDLTLAIEV